MSKLDQFRDRVRVGLKKRADGLWPGSDRKPHPSQEWFKPTHTLTVYTDAGDTDVEVMRWEGTGGWIDGYDELYYEDSPMVEPGSLQKIESRHQASRDDLIAGADAAYHGYQSPDAFALADQAWFDSLSEDDLIYLWNINPYGMYHGWDDEVYEALASKGFWDDEDHERRVKEHPSWGTVGAKTAEFTADASECSKCGAAISFDPDTNKWADEDNGSTTCAEGGKHSPISPDEHQSAKRKQGATLDAGPRDFFLDQLKAQIGMMNILAVSGGRVEVHSNGIRLPVRYGYTVVVFLEADDTYTVQTTFTRSGNTKVVNETQGVYADQVGESVYQASLYLDKPWEKGGQKTAALQWVAVDTKYDHVVTAASDGVPFTAETVKAWVQSRNDSLKEPYWVVRKLVEGSRKQGLSGLWRWEQSEDLFPNSGTQSLDDWVAFVPGGSGQEAAYVTEKADGTWEWGVFFPPGPNGIQQLKESGDSPTLEEGKKAAEFAGIEFPGSERLPFAAGRHKRADLDPTTVGVKVGDIFVATWGYDQTNVDFYEITGLTAASVRVRKLQKNYTESGAMSMAGKSVPLPGQYSSGEVTKRLLWSGYSNEPEIKVGYQTWATPWDGQPEYESHYATRKQAENLSEWVKRGYADFQAKTPWERAPEGSYEAWRAGEPESPESTAYWSGFDAAGNDAVFRAGSKGSAKVAYDPEMAQLGDMFNQQFEDMKGKERADTLPCPEHKDKEATKGGTYASFPSSYTEYHCPEGHDFKVRVGTTHEEILAEGSKTALGESWDEGYRDRGDGFPEWGLGSD